MLEHLDEIIHGRLLGALGAVLITFELVVMAIAMRRRDRPLPLRVHAIAGLLIVALPVAVAFSVHAARAMTLRGLHGPGQPGETGAIAHGLAGQLNAIPFLIATSVLVLMFWFVGLAFTISRPQADGRVRSLPPVMLVAVGLLPVMYGALFWCTSIIMSFAALAGATPDERAAVLSTAMEAARVRFQRAEWISLAAIPILAVAAVVVIILRDRSREPAAAPALSRRATLALAAAFVGLAGLLVVEARPLARENDLAWPPLTFGPQLVHTVPTAPPDLAGPDAVVQAPVVVVYPDGVRLDGATVGDMESLYEKLDVLRVNYQLLHSGSFNDTVVLVADRGAAMPRVHAVLQAALQAEYHKPLFTFAKAEAIERPVLGRLERTITSAVRVKLAYADGKNDDDDDDEAAQWKDAVALRPRDFAVYEPFARRLVDLRRAGKPVVVMIDRPAR